MSGWRNRWRVGVSAMGAVIVYGLLVAAARQPDALPLQVALDRAGFSVGEIDGRSGAKTRKALQAYQQARHLSDSDAPDPVEPTTTYTITEADAAGPFVEQIPKDLGEQGTLEQLGYQSIVEMLAERFHASPALLRHLNGGARATFAAGATLTVPNVEPLVPPTGSGRRKDAGAANTINGNGRTNGSGRPSSSGRTSGASGASGPNGAAHAAHAAHAAQPAPSPAPAEAVEVIVSKANNDLAVLDSNGAVIFYAPVSSGSAHDPLPIGDWLVRGVYLNPRFFYNPDLFWDADPSHTKTRIAAGPNNPVGFVWIDLNRDHYGLHGTPEPASVGVTQSHGCVRLTNWDAVRLAALVHEGTRVSFRP